MYLLLLPLILLVSWILFSDQIRWKQSLHTGCWRQKDARLLSGDSTWRLRRRWMDDGHENRRNKGISYNSNDHEIKTVVFIKGLREKREHSILSSTQDSLLRLLVHTIQFNKTFRARWLADLEVISKGHSLPISQRNKIARQQFSFRPSFFFFFFLRIALQFEFPMLKSNLTAAEKKKVSCLKTLFRD